MKVEELLKESAQRWKDKHFIIDAQRRWRLTYSDILGFSNNPRQCIALNGYKSRKRVRVLLCGSIFTFFKEWIAGILSGDVPVPMNPLVSQVQIEPLLLLISPQEIVVSTKFFNAMAACRTHWKSCCREKDITGAEIISFEGGAFKSPEIEEEVGQFGITTGTTGNPKIVPQTHSMVLSVVNAIQNTYRITEKDRGLMVLPPWCVDGLVANVLTSAATGATTVVMEKFDIDSFYSAIHEHKVTYSVVVPDMLQWILDTPESWPALDSLRFFITGGDILPVDLHAKFMEMTGIPVYLDWGMTETMGWGTLHPSDEICYGSIGFPATIDTEIKIVNPDTHLEVPDKEPGLMLIKGPQVFNGYYPTSESSQWYDNYFGTGDIVYRDHNGRLFFEGRHSHDVVKLKGYYIDLNLLDHELQKLTGVDRACCVVSPSEPGRKKIVAAIMKEKGAWISSAMVMNEISKLYGITIPRYSKISEVYLLEELPFTRKGKPDRLAVESIIAEIGNRSLIPS